MFSRARRTIAFTGEASDSVIMICEGWAISFIQLPDGRRQILSVLLPGDLVSVASLFDRRQQTAVQTLTDVSYCLYHRLDVLQKLMAEPPVMDALGAITIAEKQEADALLMDLGRRTAEERIALLILRLLDRLGRRNLARGDVVNFPLRQQHIADITGLTPVHVNRTLGNFRRDGILEISDCVLKILDMHALRRLGETRCP